MLGVLAKYFQDVSVLRRLLLAVCFLNQELPMFWPIVLEFATEGKIQKFSITPDQVKAVVENIEEFNRKAFVTDEELQRELIYHISPGRKPLGFPLISPISLCVLCGGQLQLRKDRHAPIILYDNQFGTIPGAHFHKFCPKRSCSLTQSYGYYCANDKIVFNDNWNSLPYMISSRETGFSMGILRDLDAHAMIGQISFKQEADIYNYIHKYNKPESNELNTLRLRQCMDRRRLEDAYFQYAALHVAHWYPSHLSMKELYLHDGLSGTLSKITPQLHTAFISKYAGHRCNCTGCGEVLVLDGNAKNSREVCYATEAGYTEYSGLPGKFQTGCPNTPAFKSRYCSLHTPLTAICRDIEFDLEGSPISRSQKQQSDGLVAVITGKRVTRTSRYYQVLWLGRSPGNSTWEPESSLPNDLIASYEAGELRDVTREATLSGGQTTCTLSSVSIPGHDTPKRVKIDPIHYISESSGSFTVPESGKALRCRTEKDSMGRLNNRTAGILAGIHPCGTITLLGELFGAESKSQVYGHLHSFFFDNKDATDSIRIVCYDDACHLKKYAINPGRCDLTPTAKHLSTLKYAVDRMHFKGHIDPWCREECDPDRFKELEKVNTEICEQTFSWLSKYSKITRHMNKERFFFYLLYLCELRNNYSR